MKEFADDNFKFEENDRKLSKQVENTVGKGEIACYEQFLLFPQCFQKACFPGASKVVIVWERVKMSSAICFNLDQSNILSSVAGLILLEKMMTFDVPEVNVFFKHCTQHFYLFPTMYSIIRITNILRNIFIVICKIPMLSIQTGLKFCCLLMG